MYYDKNRAKTYTTRAALIADHPELGALPADDVPARMQQLDIIALRVIAPQDIDYTLYTLAVGPIDVDAGTVTLNAVIRADIDLEALRAQRLAAVRAAVDTAARAVVANVSQTEQQTWPTQLAEALELERYSPDTQPDYAAAAPLLTLMAGQRGLGETVPDLAARVLAAAARYTAAVGVLVGWGQRTERELIAAADAEAQMSVSITPPSV